MKKYILPAILSFALIGTNIAKASQVAEEEPGSQQEGVVQQAEEQPGENGLQNYGWSLRSLIESDNTMELADVLLQSTQKQIRALSQDIKERILKKLESDPNFKIEDVFDKNRLEALRSK